MQNILGLQYYKDQMCVDDYQFRHFSAKRQKMCRRFIFITQHGNQRAFNVNISQFERFGQLCLCEILLHLSKKGLNTKDYSFHMPQFNITIEAGDKCKVPFQIMSSKEVYFQMNEIEKDTDIDNYKKLYYDPFNPKNEMESQKGDQMAQINEFISKSNEKMCEQCQNWKNSQVVEKTCQQNSSSKQNNNFEEQKSQKESQSFMNSSYNIKITQTHNISEKKHKEQEKTIEQALSKTKAWRALHENCNFSLKNAAQMVQLSKKTLDDYFLVLRVGEAHGYNFKANLTKKIGHLRAFIRNQPVKISGRLPKQVSSFSLVPDPDMTKFLQIQNWDKMKHIEQQTIQKKTPNNQFQQEMIAE